MLLSHLGRESNSMMVAQHRDIGLGCEKSDVEGLGKKDFERGNQLVKKSTINNSVRLDKKLFGQ